MVFETVEVLVPLVAHVALVRLFFFHADRARIRLIVVRIQDGECPISVFLQPLVLVSVSFVVFQPVGISIGFIYVCQCVSIKQKGSDLPHPITGHRNGLGSSCGIKLFIVSGSPAAICCSRIRLAISLFGPYWPEPSL